MKKIVKILIAASAAFGLLIGLNYFIGQFDGLDFDDYDY